MSLEELKRARSAARGWLKRARVKLEAVIAAEQSDEVALQSYLDDFDQRLANLDFAQGKLELVLDDDELESDFEKAAEIRDAALSIRVQAVRRKVACERDSAPPGDVGSSSAPQVRLPQIELPKFGGDVVEWSTFWDQFNATVDQSDLATVSKLVYLRSLLYGEAKQAIDGLAVTATNYEVACKILKARFARPAKVIFAHIEKLLKMGSGSDLKSVQDELLVHIRSLERLGVGGEQYGVILTPLVLSRLPEDFRLEWHETVKEKRVI